LVKARHIPIRTCVSCGVKRPQADLIRVWTDTQGTLLIGLALVNPRLGRGVYLCKDSQCWDPKAYTRGLEKGLRITVSGHTKTCLSSYYKQSLDMSSGEAL
jgi:predicted RNA-binding protein YlxR (DUF448 family)